MEEQRAEQNQAAQHLADLHSQRSDLLAWPAEAGEQADEQNQAAQHLADLHTQKSDLLAWLAECLYQAGRAAQHLAG
jgi:hypothetical protein